MRSFQTVFLLLGLFILLPSCSKDDVSVKDEVTAYFRLNTGSYWVYDWYDIDVDSEELIYESDTVIVSDTTIQGRKYFIKSQQKFGTSQILFDSANSIYNFPDRNLVFTLDRNQEKTTIINYDNNIVITGTFQMSDEMVTVNVNGGIYDCLNWRGAFTTTDESYPHGVRYNDNYYSKNVGLVKARIPTYNSTNNLEMRLTVFGNLLK